MEINKNGDNLDRGFEIGGTGGWDRWYEMVGVKTWQPG